MRRYKFVIIDICTIIKEKLNGVLSLVICPRITIIKILAPLNERIVVLDIGSRTVRVRDNNLLTQPPAVYGVIPIIGDPASTPLIEDIDISSISRQRD